MAPQASRPDTRSFDYESFTDSWLAADMTAGGRHPAIVGLLRQPQPMGTPK
jgi:hypothetical protein